MTYVGFHDLQDGRSLTTIMEKPEVKFDPGPGLRLRNDPNDQAAFVVSGEGALDFSVADHQVTGGRLYMSASERRLAVVAEAGRFNGRRFDIRRGSPVYVADIPIESILAIVRPPARTSLFGNPVPPKSFRVVSSMGLVDMSVLYHEKQGRTFERVRDATPFIDWLVSTCRSRCTAEDRRRLGAAGWRQNGQTELAVVSPNFELMYGGV